MKMRTNSKAPNANRPTCNAGFSSSSAYLYGFFMDMALAVSIFALSFIRLFDRFIHKLKFT